MDIIRQRQPKKAAGFVATRSFTKSMKVKRNRHEINLNQTTKASPWDHIMATTTKVDADRVNWKGIIYLQEECGVYDPKPRLVKRG